MHSEGPCSLESRREWKVTAESHGHHGLSLALGARVTGILSSTGHRADLPCWVHWVTPWADISWVDLGSLSEECSSWLEISQDSFLTNPT